MAQEQKQPKKSSEEAAPQEEVAPETDVAERKEALDDDIDAILDEIDEVLESNAEDLVKSFIQKGGQCARTWRATSQAAVFPRRTWSPARPPAPTSWPARRPTCCRRAVRCRPGRQPTWRRTARPSSPRR